jgi:hypothetical protein
VRERECEREGACVFGWCVCICVRERGSVRERVGVYACVFVCMYACVYVCIHACVRACQHCAKLKTKKLKYTKLCRHLSDDRDQQSRRH